MIFMEDLEELGFIFLLIILIISTVNTIVTMVGQWKIFKKAGKKGWKAIIPIYNSVVACQITGLTPWWVLIKSLASFLTSILIKMNIDTISTVNPVIKFLSLAILVYYSVILSLSMAKSFGKSTGFAIGLLLLPPIFYMILGCNDDKYIGPQPVDPIGSKLMSKK